MTQCPHDVTLVLMQASIGTQTAGGLSKECGVQCRPSLDDQLPSSFAAARSSVTELKSPAYVTASGKPAGDGASGASQAQAIIAALHDHASDIAHDMKNPLNGVLALSQNVMQVRAESMTVIKQTVPSRILMIVYSQTVPPCLLCWGLSKYQNPHPP
jgi:signal transduction histidine kinase